MLRRATPPLSWGTAYALPSENRVSSTGPRAGRANQLDTESEYRIAAVTTKATPVMIHFRRRSPPSTARQVSADSRERTTSVGRPILGSPSQLLNLMATYCLRRTATQNSGREKKRNAV